MRYWQTPYLGLRSIPKELNQFELNAFFSYSPKERSTIFAKRDGLHRLALALQIGFIRMTGSLLTAVKVVPAELWAHLGETLGIETPNIASLRSLYRRHRTLFTHQNAAMEVLGFARMSEHQRRALVRYLRTEVMSEFDRHRLMTRVNIWLYEHGILIEGERPLKGAIAAALKLAEDELEGVIQQDVPATMLAAWVQACHEPDGKGLAMQEWLAQAPHRNSLPQIREQFERIQLLTQLGVAAHPMPSVSDHIKRHYAQAMADRPPSVSKRLADARRTIEVSCFLHTALCVATDRLLAMTRQHIADLWRKGMDAVTQSAESRARTLTAFAKEIRELALDSSLSEGDLRKAMLSAVEKVGGTKRITRARLTREQLLIQNSRNSRSLLKMLCALPFESASPHPVIQAMDALRAIYQDRKPSLPEEIPVALGKVWDDMLVDIDRQRALQAFEVATLLAMRRALKSGSLYIGHSFSFRSRESMLIPADEWAKSKPQHYARLKLPRDPKEFTEPLIKEVSRQLQALDKAVKAGDVLVDTHGIHIPKAAAEDVPEGVSVLRDALVERIGAEELPGVMMEVDSHTRFSWMLLGREPRSVDELRLVYAGLLAHGTALSAADTARMMPGLSAQAVNQSMRWMAQEKRLREANAAVFEFMHSHPIAESWGRADLASADMMSRETVKSSYLARRDPRTKKKSIGIYTHIHDRWGIFYDQPIVLGERQAGVALEGVLRQDTVAIKQLAVDTHGQTEFSMFLGKTVQKDICPRLRDASAHKLYVTPEMEVPEGLSAVIAKNLAHPERLEAVWDECVRMAASTLMGKASAVDILSRFGSAAKGDALYDAGVQIGRLLLTLFLCRWFTLPEFRREILRTLNHGERVHVLEHALETGKVPRHQLNAAIRLRGVSSSITLLSNIVMAWTTTRMQQSLAGLPKDIGAHAVPENLRHIAPIQEGLINFRGLFVFPIERYMARLLPGLQPVRSVLRGIR
ncbi:MAG: Tn3 family transposase [Castellaniella sp.]|nr:MULTISPECIES: Tn3 family transposase [Rhodanobacter]MDE2225464.1 Tn3 family transposase [Xanthomonadaceae bacterium]TAN25216.1 MAG: Tn3 family transposase [Castellaniella sp.]UJJ53398.1 Tn3 family transposase [Rhodanobacter thiooxydans]